MTAHYCDFQNSDCILTIGSNNVENHPVTAAWVNDAKRLNGAKYIVVDPRFTRSAATADIYAPLRAGTDIAFFGGMINYILENNRWQPDFVKSHTNASFLVSPNYSFDEAAGLFSGYNKETGAYDMGPEAGAWVYQGDTPVPWDITGPYAWTQAPGVPEFTPGTFVPPLKDPTLQDELCVFNVMKKHYSRYTPELVSKITGTPMDKLLEIYDEFSKTGAPDKAGNILYAMGQTQHTYGTQNIRAMAIIQLLLGNVGNAGGGIQALRGEANVQGSTDFGLLNHILPGYLPTPNGADASLRAYLERTLVTNGYWSNRPKFVVSYLKELYGPNANVDNDYMFDMLPKVRLGVNHSFIGIFEAINEGKIKGMFLWGQNPAVGGPNSVFEREMMRKLDWLVAVDLWETESAIVWKDPAVDPAESQTEVYMLPAACHYEKQGTVSHSGRWIQWRYQVVDAPGEAIDDLEIMHRLYKALVAKYEAEGGANPDQLLKLHWPYEREDGHSDIMKVAQAINGYKVNPDGTQGDLLPNFTGLTADGNTACGCWIYGGYFNNNAAPEDPTKQPTGSRNNEDPSGLKLHPRWAFSWPVNRRILYNRASCAGSDTTFEWGGQTYTYYNGQSYNPNRKVVEWDKDAGKWNAGAPAFLDAEGKEIPPAAFDVPDFAAATPNPDPTLPPIPVTPDKTPSFFMNYDLKSHLWNPGTALADGPFPEHYEPFESPVKNMMSAQETNPRLTFGGAESVKRGDASQYPIVCTTYRLSEHWQTGGMTRNIPWLAEAMPAMFVEMSKELAEEKGIANGDKVRVFNNRGDIEMVAMVTPRFKPLDIDGQTVHQVGMPWHWGYASGNSTGATANDLTPNVGDANTSIPEYKAFLVDLEKA